MRIKFLIFFLCLFFSNIVFAQVRPDQLVINYTSYHKPLRTVLKDLANLASVSIVYSESRLAVDKPVSISVNGETLGEVLKIVLSEFNFTYQLVGNQIVLVNIQSPNLSKDVTIYGYLKDRISGELLIGANVFLFDRSAGTATNEYGFYSFKLPAQTQRIYFSYLGYNTEVVEFYLNKDTLINISLSPDAKLNEIVILDNLLEEEYESSQSQQNLHIDKILSTNHLAGEADVIRYLTLLPGVSTGADGIGGINVRGGSADQNLVLLDGVPVYNTGHALGIFSVFNSSIIKSATFIKSGIPARYGGRLSSVLDIHTRDGNFNEIAGEVSLSTIAVKASLEGPIAKGKSSFLVSYRRTFLDIWIKELTQYINTNKDQSGFANYFFQDFNGKLNFHLDNKNRLLINVYSGNDDFNNTTTFQSNNILDSDMNKLEWGNQMISARWTSEFSKNLFSKFTIYHSAFNFESFTRNRYSRTELTDTISFYKAGLFDSGIKEYGAFYDLDWLPHRNHYIKTGVRLQSRHFSPRVINISGKTNPDDLINGEITPDYIKALNPQSRIQSEELTIFAEDEWQISPGTLVNFGVHMSGIAGDNDTKFTSFQPRVSFITSGEHLFFKTGVSRLQQFLHLLTNNGLGLPTDIWLPSGKNLPPSKSWVFNAGLGYRNNTGYKAGVEIYYKYFDDISSYREGGSIDIHDNIFWESSIPIGNGEAYGAECYFEKVGGNTLFAFNYSYSVSNRTFKALNNGNPFPFNFNRLHNFKVSFTHRFSAFSEFLLNWNISSGNPFTRPSNTSVLLDDQIVVLYLEKNNALFPVFHRLDVGMSFYNAHKWGRTKLFLGLYNTYNRRNPFYADLTRDKINPEKFEFRQFSLLPLLPTISYSVSF